LKKHITKNAQVIPAVQDDSGWGTPPLYKVSASTSFGIKYILFDHNKNSSSNKLQKNINKRKKKNQNQNLNQLLIFKPKRLNFKIELNL
jgi:putative protein kinase ArgK-like GTPase of G3E family